MPLQATSGAASYDAFGGGVPVVPNYIEDVFSTYLYTGNSPSTQTINNGIDLLNKGGLFWGKARDFAGIHYLVDTVRGDDNYLRTNGTNAQVAFGAGNTFAANGFNLSANNNLNSSGTTYASWTFRKQPKFFDVVTWTGDGTSGRSISHSLGSAPACVFVKRTNSAADWVVYHRSLSESASYSYNLFLNLTLAQANDSLFGLHSQQTSTQFKLGSNANAALINNTGDTYVAYLFAHDAGGFGLTGTDNVISCGSYTEPASGFTDINLGYEVQWLLTKSTTTGDWVLTDIMQGMSETSISYLKPNSSAATTSFSGSYLVPTATGFRAYSGFYGSGTNLIYIAIRRGPMKVPTSGTSVYNGIARTGNGTTTAVTGVGFPPDMVLVQRRNGSGDSTIYDKLRGPNTVLYPQYTLQEYSVSSYLNSFDQNGVTLGTNTPNISGETFINWMFRRAPSFFDEVCYTGTGVAGRTVTHNLTVVPELMIVKARSQPRDWLVYSSGLTTDYFIVLNSSAPQNNSNYAFIFGNNTVGIPPTSSVFTVGSGSDTNANGSTYVAYLFATCAGVSKVGSYTGTATTLQVNCGFTGGARFVLIKRTDSTGDWYVWDTARGIVSGNDSYLLLNSTAAEVTNTDYIDTYSAGFEISSTAPAAINASGGTFVFLAIA